MRIRSITASLILAGVLALGGAISAAWAQDATPVPTDHAAHHPGNAASSAAGAAPMTGMTGTMPMTATASMGDMTGMTGTMPMAGTMPMTGTMPMQGMGGMGNMGGMADMAAHMKSMQGMMAHMQGMPMSSEMKSMMDQMQTMMKSMDMGDMHDPAAMEAHMKSMQDMMAHMQSMEMSPEMKSMMDQMQTTMGDMMKAMPMQGMGDMGTGGTGTMSGMQPGSSASMPGMSGGHGMEPIPSAGVPAASQNVGGQPLEPQVVDGVKVFNLTAEPVIWNLTENVTVTAWTYNGTVPGPLLRATVGDKVRIVLTNKLPEATTIHWHGIDVPNAMDGVPDMPTPAIKPGEVFTYEFTLKTPGSYMYHSHTDSDTQVSVGLYAPFIVDPATPEATPPAVDASLMLSEWRVVDGQTYPAMPMAMAEPNYFTINGKAFPATETLKAKVGDRIRLRLMNIGQFVHPIHVHGAAFKVVATDGHPVPEAAQLTKDTIAVAPGERYDIEFTFTEPGTWMVHCHILHHTTNDGVDGGGMMLRIDVAQ